MKLHNLSTSASHSLTRDFQSLNSWELKLSLLQTAFQTSVLLTYADKWLQLLVVSFFSFSFFFKPFLPPLPFRVFTDAGFSFFCAPAPFQVLTVP
jgi:hypothetical protein